MPLPPQDPQLPALIDGRERYYRLTTPGDTTVSVRLAAPDDPACIQIRRPTNHGRRLLCLSIEETWALWACLVDGIGTTGEPPDWTAHFTPTDADGQPLTDLSPYPL